MCTTTAHPMLSIRALSQQQKPEQKVVQGTWHVAVMDLPMWLLWLGLFCERKVEDFGALGWRRHWLLRGEWAIVGFITYFCAYACFAYMYVCEAYACLASEVTRGLESPAAAVRGGREPLCVCWESNPGPLQDSRYSKLLSHLCSPSVNFREHNWSRGQKLCSRYDLSIVSVQVLSEGVWRGCYNCHHQWGTSKNCSLPGVASHPRLLPCFRGVGWVQGKMLSLEAMFWNPR